jgi:hypothetical protein
MSVAVLLLLQVAAGQPTRGQEVLASMHERWAGRWFTTLTFVQRTTFPDRPPETWYESVATPGRLRIDFGPVDSMNTAIIKDDSVHRYRHGKLVGSRPYSNMLGVALSDVYAQPVAATAAMLEREGVDLSRVRPDTLRGRQVWVIGGAVGDTTSPQLWVERERLLLLRICESGPDGRTLMGDVLARAEGPIPVETELVFRESGAEAQREVYTQIAFNPRLDPWTFLTGEWRRPSWIPR